MAWGEETQKESKMINKNFVIIIINVVLALGLAVTGGLVLIALLNTDPITGARVVLWDVIIYAVLSFLGTCTVLCFLIIGVLKVAELEKINESLKLKTNSNIKTKVLKDEKD